ncbi:hypothetical protein [Streptomyces mirabilis]|uniref:hypothetical protein n=1 Tax=Streptomyces mirabilis TaxID=68239 RepID=UPI0033CA2383
MRRLRFHPLSDIPLFESQRLLRGHAFYPGASVLRSLAPRTPRLPAGEASCVVYHSAWGHLVVTEIDPETLNGYGWTCLSNFPLGAEWGDLGDMREIEQRRGHPWEYWERDLHSDDPTAADAIDRILRRYAPAVTLDAQEEPTSSTTAATPDRQLPRPAQT